jgi:hypothetical protein
MLGVWMKWAMSRLLDYETRILWGDERSRGVTLVNSSSTRLPILLFAVHHHVLHRYSALPVCNCMVVAL